MKTYARMVDGRRAQIISTMVDANGLPRPPFETRFSADVVAQLVEYDPNRPTPPSDPEPPVDVVPSIVTNAQARLALLNAGLLAEVDAAIAALPSPEREAAEIDWNYRPTVERDSPIVAMLAPILGLDEQALDALFIAAADL